MSGYESFLADEWERFNDGEVPEPDVLGAAEDAAELSRALAWESSDLSPRGSAQSGASAQTRQARPD